MFYEIYDVRNRDFRVDLPIVQAITAREAVLKFIRDNGILFERNSGYKFDFKATPFHFIGCYKYFIGKSISFKIV